MANEITHETNPKVSLVLGVTVSLRAVEALAGVATPITTDNCDKGPGDEVYSNEEFRKGLLMLVADRLGLCVGPDLTLLVERATAVVGIVFGGAKRIGCETFSRPVLCSIAENIHLTAEGRKIAPELAGWEKAFGQTAQLILSMM